MQIYFKLASCSAVGFGPDMQRGGGLKRSKHSSTFTENICRAIPKPWVQIKPLFTISEWEYIKTFGSPVLTREWLHGWGFSFGCRPTQHLNPEGFVSAELLIQFRQLVAELIVHIFFCRIWTKVPRKYFYDCKLNLSAWGLGAYRTPFEL